MADSISTTTRERQRPEDGRGVGIAQSAGVSGQQESVREVVSNGVTTSPAARVGEWMCTFTGRKLWPCDPRAEDICIKDIAHHLAQENRFNGALPEPYSVAQHSVLVSQLVELQLGGTEEEAKWALLHDASEAYLRDIHRPLKMALGEAYRVLERRMMAVICERFGLAREEPSIVKSADNLALALERRDLFPASHQQLWKTSADGIAPHFRVKHKGWYAAELEFLAQFRRLFGEVG